MKMDLFVQKSSNLFAENRLLKFVIVVLTIGTMFSMYQSRAALNYQRTIIIPISNDFQLEFQGDKANEEYYKVMIRHVVGLLLNYQPKTAKAQFDEILVFAHPEFYPELKSQLVKIAENIERLSVSSIFYPQTIEVDPNTKTVVVTGLRRQYAHSSPIEDKDKKYTILFDFLNRKFVIKNIKEEQSS